MWLALPRYLPHPCAPCSCSCFARAADAEKWSNADTIALLLDLLSAETRWWLNCQRGTAGDESRATRPRRSPSPPPSSSRAPCRRCPSSPPHENSNQRPQRVRAARARTATSERTNETNNPRRITINSHWVCLGNPRDSGNCAPARYIHLEHQCGAKVRFVFYTATVARSRGRECVAVSYAAHIFTKL